MKILFLNNYYYPRGGSERVFFSDMQIMRAQGNLVVPFCRRTSDDLENQYARFFPRDMQTAQVSVSLASIKTVYQLISSRETALALQKLLDEFSPDIAHAHNIYGRLTTSVLKVLQERNIPVVMTLHDYKLICPSYNMQWRGRPCEACEGRHFYRSVLRRCHKDSVVASSIYAAEAYYNKIVGRYRKGVRKFISPSNFLKKKLVQYGWPETQIEVIPNCLDISTFEPCYAPGEYLLYLGRLSQEKGVDLLLKAFTDLPRSARLVIAGTGPSEAELKVQANGDERINFVGHVGGNNLKDLVQNSRAIVLPSVWYENAPMSLLEAMAYGKPVVAASIGGIPEMIFDGETGLLFDTGNVESLRVVLGRILTMSAEDIERLGMAGRALVTSKYSTEAHYKYLIGIYEKAMNKCY